MLKISGATLCLCLLTVLVLFPGTCSPASVKGFGKLSNYATLLSFPVLYFFSVVNCVFGVMSELFLPLTLESLA